MWLCVKLSQYVCEIIKGALHVFAEGNTSLKYVWTDTQSDEVSAKAGEGWVITKW